MLLNNLLTISCAGDRRYDRHGVLIHVKANDVLLDLELRLLRQH